MNFFKISKSFLNSMGEEKENIFKQFPRHKWQERYQHDLLLHRPTSHLLVLYEHRLNHLRIFKRKKKQMSKSKNIQKTQFAKKLQFPTWIYLEFIIQFRRIRINSLTTADYFWH